MNRAEAAHLLGVDPAADEAEVRAAFRKRVAAVHPDRAGHSSDPDIGRLPVARDVLLSIAPNAPTRRHPDAAPGPRPKSPGAGPTGEQALSLARGGRFGRFLWTAVLTIAALLFVAITGLVVIAVASGGDTVPAETRECLLIAGDGPTEVDCDEPGARVVVSQHQGARSCSPGSDTLIVGSTTWCLASPVP